MNAKHFATWILVAVQLIAAHPLYAYVQPVHRRMTERAFTRVLPELERRVGIRPSDRIKGETPAAIVSQGAHDEDRLFPDARSLHHFFNPVDLSPLTIPYNFICTPVGFRADYWAIDGAPLNGYSVTRAKGFYEESLLGPNRGTRESAQHELLLALGHMVHLIQDMAQPEHTRNDQHLPGSAIGQDSAASIWENWGEANLTSVSTAAVSFDGYPNVSLPDYASYFHTYEFDNGRRAGRGLADYSNRNFVTQDTNYPGSVQTSRCRPPRRCFYYDDPRIDEAARRTLPNQSYGIVEFVTDAAGAIVPVPSVINVDVEAYTSFPRDYYAQVVEPDYFHSFRSSFDIESGDRGCGEVYSLGPESYLTRAALLVPRAVGYSAGFIKHFFRGDIETKWSPTQIPGRYFMTVTNKSAEVIGSDATVEAIFKAPSTYFGRANSDDTGIIIAKTRLADVASNFDGLTPGESVTITVNPFELKPEDSLLEFERNIVVRGTLGSEVDAVIGLNELPSLRTLRTLHFNRPETSPYFEPRNFTIAQVYGIFGGAFAFGHPELQASSGVYMNTSRGGSFTFVWHQEAFASSFRLINGDEESRVQVRTSTNVFHDQTVYFDQVLAPFSEQMIELPEGTARFTVLSYAGFVAMDDVSWDFIIP
jgi:hypothetical protein